MNRIKDFNKKSHFGKLSQAELGFMQPKWAKMYLYGKLYPTIYCNAISKNLSPNLPNLWWEQGVHWKRNYLSKILAKNAWICYGFLELSTSLFSSLTRGVKNPFSDSNFLGILTLQNKPPAQLPKIIALH